jgi:hypothetical protein
MGDISGNNNHVVMSMSPCLLTIDNTNGSRREYEK